MNKADDYNHADYTRTCRDRERKVLGVGAERRGGREEECKMGRKWKVSDEEHENGNLIYYETHAISII